METCNHYPEAVNIDPNWKAARAFSTLALIVGGILLVTRTFFTFISPEKRMTIRLEGLGYLTCCVCQGLSLLFLTSDACVDNYLINGTSQSQPLLGFDFPDTCTLSSGSKCVIAAVVSWFLAAIATMRANNVPTNDKESGWENSSAVTEPLIKEDAPSIIFI